MTQPTTPAEERRAIILTALNQVDQGLKAAFDEIREIAGSSRDIKVLQHIKTALTGLRSAEQARLAHSRGD